MKKTSSRYQVLKLLLHGMNDVWKHIDAFHAEPQK